MSFACFSTLGCPDLSIDDVVALAVSRGIPAVEIRALDGTVDLLAVLGRRFGTHAAARVWAAAQPVRIVALGTGFRLIGEAVPRHALAAWGAWADALGADRLRLFDGGKAGDAAEVARAAETLARGRAWRVADGWAADLMIETHHAFARPDALAAFLAAAPDCPILWDTHHTWKRGGEDPVATWRRFRGQVVHVHVKDSVGDRYCLPGQGGFPMANLRAALAADAYAGPVSLEWERLWHPLLPPLADALDAAQSARWWA